MASQSGGRGSEDNELITVDDRLWTIADYDYDDIHIIDRVECVTAAGARPVMWS
jgi:hypothetical protein